VDGRDEVDPRARSKPRRSSRQREDGPRCSTPYPQAGIVGLLAYLILLAVSGLVGALTRLALPGPDPMTVFQTILLGLAGNLIAGVIVWLLWAHRLPGLLISVACSSVILYFIRRSRGGGLARPGAPLR